MSQTQSSDSNFVTYQKKGENALKLHVNEALGVDFDIWNTNTRWFTEFQVLFVAVTNDQYNVRLDQGLQLQQFVFIAPTFFFF